MRRADAALPRAPRALLREGLAPAAAHLPAPLGLVRALTAFAPAVSALPPGSLREVWFAPCHGCNYCMAVCKPGFLCEQRADACCAVAQCLDGGYVSKGTYPVTHGEAYPALD